MVQFQILYWIAMNVIGFCLMYADKEKAKKGQYRISEKSLWTVSILGGALGSFIALKKFRHKSKHATFRIGFFLLSIIHLSIIGYVVSQ